jgi:hypothetical protein
VYVHGSRCGDARIANIPRNLPGGIIDR